MAVVSSSPLLSHTVLLAGEGMVTANHLLAAEAGAEILARGGNAVDAAVATSLALGVVEPAMSGLGGRGYLLIHAPESGSAAIDGHERAPRAAQPDMFTPVADAESTPGWGPLTRVEGDANAIGHLAVAVPGALAAAATAHARYGRLPWPSLAEPAIQLAENGFEVSVLLAVLLARHQDKLLRFPATAAVFQPRLPGERLVQMDLARTLRTIAEHGPDVFYRGQIAHAIDAEMAAQGGVLTERDLAEFGPRVWDQPEASTYRGHTILGLPDWTGGPILSRILTGLESHDLAALDPCGPEHVACLLDAMRAAFRDRLAAVAEQDTTHFCVVDRDMMVVSMTQSIVDAFGSGVVVPGTGILLNSAMHNFDPRPGRVGSVGPWKRSAHYGTPTIVLRPDGQPRLAIGGAGGTKITTGVAQVLVNVLDHGQTLQAAIDAPRVHNEGETRSQIDARLPSATCGQLADVDVVRPAFAQPVWARVNGIHIARDQLESGIDPYGDGGAAIPGR